MLELGDDHHGLHCLSQTGQYGDNRGTFIISDSHTSSERSEAMIVPMSQTRGSEVVGALPRAIWLVSGRVQTQVCPIPTPPPPSSLELPRVLHC